MPAAGAAQLIAGRAGAALDRVRQRHPLVQNITNYVSMDIAANALLALGASPAMVHAPEEIEDFGRFTDALVINIGTLSADWVNSMVSAASLASRQQKPWVLDPVGAGATAYRNRSVTELIALKPTVIRGNASEILAVATAIGVGHSDARARGVDSANTTDEARDVAEALAQHLACVVVATGAVDLVTDGSATRLIHNGSPLMARVTAVGCALSAITAAFCAAEPDIMEAATAAVAVVGVAGDVAAEQTTLPGSFRTAWLDALASIDAGMVATRLRVS